MTTTTGITTSAEAAASTEGNREHWWQVWRWPLLLWELLWLAKPSPIGMTVD